MKIYENYAILEGDAPALVTEMSSSTDITKDYVGDGAGIPREVEGHKDSINFYPWGVDNNLPTRLIELSYKNNVLASNLDFNARISYGEKAIPVRIKVDENTGEMKHIPLLRSEAPEIFDFIEENNYALIQQELAHDLSLLHNGFVELILNKARTKIVQIRFKEAAFSRLSVMNDKGEIEWHGYSSDWLNNSSISNETKTIVTRLLDYDNPIFDLRVKMGKRPGRNGSKNKLSDYRYMLHLGQPAPGKFYYQKAYWWSIFESHWFDFACAIPEFKMNLMKNQMVLKYHIQVRKGFFEDMYQVEGISDPEKKKKRRADFFKQLEDFLSGKENAGKNMVSEIDFKSFQQKIEIEDIRITPIESFIKGGEYIEDSEEASNAICYAMGVHPSLQGASPGKNKNISGTEARELFIIKQSLMKPTRDLLVQPLRIVKAINGWPSDIDFVIPNIMLTTLDKNTGAEKQIGNPKV